METRKRKTTKEILQGLVEELVDHPEEVRVKEMVGDQSITLEITVKEEEIGKVIGKKGRTAQALRDLMFCFAARDSKRVIVSINQ